MQDVDLDRAGDNPDKYVEEFKSLARVSLKLYCAYLSSL